MIPPTLRVSFLFFLLIFLLFPFSPSGPLVSGQQCVNGTVLECPSGSYLNSTTFSCTQCPSGTYNNLTQRTSLSDCLQCPSGSYCSGVGLVSPTGLCSPGYFCVAGSTTNQPASGRCPSGSYCPAGSSSALSCPYGYHCSGTGLSQPSGTCTAGYYCPGGSTSPTAVPCPAGSFCNGSGAPQPCPAGSYCPAQSASGLPCSPGNYSLSTGAIVCSPCPAGFVCAGFGTAVPQSCPMGSYCPNSTTSASGVRCPAGTYGNVTQLTALSGCIACPPGMACTQPGLIAPDAPCSAGFYCGSGASTSSPPSTTYTVGGNGQCPPGSYCPQGSSVPTPCPISQHSIGFQNRDISSCGPCPIGSYCSGAGSPPGAVACNGGYFCTGNSTTPSPNVTGGYQCGIGKYCPSGTTAELSCDPGSFNPSKGAASCSPCTAGFYCPDSGMNDTISCPPGYYCPQGSAIYQPCGGGYYSNTARLTAQSSCISCPFGFYCTGPASLVVGPSCPAGFWCNIRSAAPVPCPTGNYCPAGTTSLQPCPISTFRSITGGVNSSDCFACTGGSYCSTAGLSSPTNLCAAGYYCPPGSSVSNPFACPVGKACPLGSVAPSNCANGTYMNVTTAAACFTCPAGYYCVNSAVNPTICPVGYYCPLGTSNPILCPAGTYSTRLGLEKSSDCPLCPAAQYCDGGRILGNCAAGSICYSGNSVPNPGFNGSAVIAIASGGPCPAGSFCLDATMTPTPCPVLMYNPVRGGQAFSACLPCPDGYQCLTNGTVVPLACEAGYYCFNDGSKLACPIGTYSSRTAQFTSATCTPCPAGAFCNTTGIADFNLYPCPIGSYCPVQSLAPVPCLSGSYRPTLGGQAQANCTVCPAGYYCLVGSSAPLPCPAGQMCYLGSSLPTACPDEYFCPAVVPAPIPCYPGYYCPQNSSLVTLCPLGTYCVGMDAFPEYCPLGHYSRLLSNRSALATSCPPCPAGQWQNNSAELQCMTCDAGFICTGAASSPRPLASLGNGGYVCPVGYYCPAGALAPLPCPAGTFNSVVGQGSLSSCLPCPQDTYNPFNGQSACSPCPASSTAPAGSAQCRCIGRNRVFHTWDLACICEPHHEFIQDDQPLSESDGIVDCQPIVYDRCNTGYVRASNGKCVKVDGSDCQCAGGIAGQFSVNLGICDCPGVPTLETICDADCRAAALQFSYINTFDGTGAIVIRDPLIPESPSTLLNASITIPLSNVTGFLSGLSCKSSSCRLRSTIVKNGIGGVYGLTPALSQLINSGRYELGTRSSLMSAGNGEFVPMDAAQSPFHLMSRTQGDEEYSYQSPAISRLLSTITTAAASSTAAPTVNPTVICIVQDEGLLFDLSQASVGSYPIYVKDSLLNSNPQFDYGRFRQLQLQALARNSNVTLFGFTFTEPGVYVFADNLDQTKETVVKVTKSSERCPGDDPNAAFLPFTAQSLTAMGATKDTDLVITPDWLLLGMMILLVFVLCISVVAGLYYFQNGHWSTAPVSLPLYKLEALRDDLDIWNFTSKGTVRKVENISGGLVALSEDSHAHRGSLKSPLSARRASQVALAGEDSGHAKSPSIVDDEEVYLGSNGAASDDPNDLYMNELSSDIDFEGFDFQSLYKILEDTKTSIESFFDHQKDHLELFYDKMNIEIEHLKSTLAVKMQVQINKTQEGVEEAVDRLVTGELLSRQAHQEILFRLEVEFKKAVELLATGMRNLNEDFQLWPIKELVRRACEYCAQIEKAVQLERQRRKTFALHNELVGRSIIESLLKIDQYEEHIMDDYLAALKLFQVTVDDLLRKVMIEEQAHASSMEKLDESAIEKRDLEIDRFHLQIARMMRDIQSELIFLDEKISPIFSSIRECEDRTHHVWQQIQGNLLERRKEQLIMPSEGRLFRGINPDLGKVLAGLLGMRGGIEIDPATNEFRPRIPFDPSDPFSTIYDPGLIEVAEGSISHSAESEEAKKKKKKKHRKSSQVLSTAAVDQINETADGEADGDEGQTIEGSIDRPATPPLPEAIASASAAAVPIAALAAQEFADSALSAAEDTREKFLSELRRRREEIAANAALAADEREKALARLDAELGLFEKLFGSEAVSMLNFLVQQQETEAKQAEELATLEKLRAEMAANKAELDELRRKHKEEEDRLNEELIRAESEERAGFELQLSKLDEMMKSIVDEEKKKGSAADSLTASMPKAVLLTKLKSQGGAAVLTEFDVGLDEIQPSEGEEATPLSLKEELVRLHEMKREEARARRMNDLSSKHINEIKSLEAEDVQMTAATAFEIQLKEQNELAELIEEAEEQRAHEHTATTSAPDEELTSQLETVEEQQAVKVFNDKYIAIERKYAQEQLNREAELAVEAAFEWARLEFVTAQKSLAQLALKEEKIKKLKEREAEGQETADEMKDLLQEAESEKNNLESAIELERLRQKKKLQERLAEQKQKNVAALKKKKEEELKAERIKLEAVQRAAKIDKEIEIIRAAVAKLPDGPEKRAKVKKIIELILKARHHKELEALVRDQLEERADFLAEAIQNLSESEGSGSDLASIESSVATKFDEDHASAVSDLKHRQINEIREAFKEFFPDEDFSGPEWHLAAAERSKAAIIADVHAAREEAKAAEHDDTDSHSQSQLAEMKAKMEQKRREAEEEMQRLQEQMKKEEEEREAAKAAALAESKQKQLEAMKMTDLSEEQKKDLLNQHKVNQGNYSRALDNEKARQATLLEKQLAEKKRKQALLKNKKAATKKDGAAGEEEKESKEEEEIQSAESAAALGWKERGAAVLNKLGLAPSAEFKSGAAPVAIPGRTVVMTEEQLARQAAAQANSAREAEDRLKVIERLSRLEGLVMQLSDQSNQWRSQVYLDERDSTDPAMQPNADNEPCEISELDGRSLVLYRFAVSLIQVLHSLGLCKSPANAVKGVASASPVQLLIARSLSANPHQNIAFKNSFQYLDESNVLLIRKARMNDAGEFLLVLLHALAHITAHANCIAFMADPENASGSLTAVEVSALRSQNLATASSPPAWDDRDPLFAAAFHRLLRLCCADLFFAASKRALDRAPQQGEKGSLSGEAESLAIDELIDLHPSAINPANSLVTASHLPQFESSRLFARLSEYQAFQHSARLKSHLNELENSAHARENSRFLKDAKSFRSRIAKSAEPFGSADDRAWHEQGFQQRPALAQSQSIDALENAADQLNAQLATVTESLFEASAVLQDKEKRSAPEADLTLARSRVDALARAQRVVIERLRNVQSAIDQIRNKAE